LSRWSGYIISTWWRSDCFFIPTSLSHRSCSSNIQPRASVISHVSKRGVCPPARLLMHPNGLANHEPENGQQNRSLKPRPKLLSPSFHPVRVVGSLISQLILSHPSISHTFLSPDIAFPSHRRPRPQSLHAPTRSEKSNSSKMMHLPCPYHHHHHHLHHHPPQRAMHKIISPTAHPSPPI
jgi:hypothetical protein